MNDLDRPASHPLGGPPRDAAEPAHGVQPDRCAVCGTARELIRIDGGHNRHACVCPTHLRAGLHRLGQPRHPGAVLTCAACSATRPHRFAIVSVWPPHSHAHGTLVIAACRPHLTESLAAQHAASLTTETPT